MAALWPDLAAEAAGANLRKAVHVARRALGAVAITTCPDLLELWPRGDLTVQVERFEVASAAARRSGAGADVAAEQPRGELLPKDRYGEWTELRRQELRHLSLELLRASGQWERILEIDRSDEQAH
jgi:DNA-binding SARP family transcriptional activator